MSMTIHMENRDNLFATNDRVSQNSKTESGQNKRNTLFAGDLKAKPDTIEMKRQQAQKKALKIVGDTFKSEKELDQHVTDMMDQRQSLQDQNVQNIRMIQDIDEDKQQCMDSYQVTEDSPEQQDLELLRKEKMSLKPNSDVELSEEESKRLEELHSNGVTDYQRDMLELDDKEELYQGYVDDNKAAIKGISESLSGIKIERLKSHAMVDAGKEAQSVLDAANGEVIGQLIDEAKDHIDETQEAEKEKADKAAEEKKEEEEKIDSSKDDKQEVKEEQQQDIIENSSSEGPKTEKKIEKIMDELNLIDEDLKGAAVDTDI